MSGNQPIQPIIVPVPDWRKSASYLGRTIDFTNDSETIMNMIRTSVQVCALKPLSSQADRDTFLCHPFANIQDMWRGYEWHLMMYAMMLVAEVQKRSPETESLKLIHKQVQSIYVGAERTNEPYWFGEGFFHESHQAWLLRAYPDDFKHHFPKTHDILPMVWPPYEACKRRVL